MRNLGPIVKMNFPPRLLFPVEMVKHLVEATTGVPVFAKISTPL